MYGLIPPAKAKATTLNRMRLAAARNGREVKVQPSTEDLIHSGRNQIIIQTLHTARQQVEVNRQGSKDRVNWRVRFNPTYKAYNTRYVRSGFLAADPETRDRQRKTAVLTRRSNFRADLDQMPDEEARLNDLVAQRAAVFTRPWLWPTNPAPVFRQSVHRDISTGWVAYTEEEGKEKWEITQTWPELRTFDYYDVFELVKQELWRVKV
jgi:hypothetical protein